MFLSICLRGHYEVTPCSFDHIRNDKCPNDSRRIMPFVAFVSFFLVPRRKVRFGEFFHSMSDAALDIFQYPLSLKARTCDN